MSEVEEDFKIAERDMHLKNGGFEVNSRDE